MEDYIQVLLMSASGLVLLVGWNLLWPISVALCPLTRISTCCLLGYDNAALDLLSLQLPRCWERECYRKTQVCVLQLLKASTSHKGVDTVRPTCTVTSAPSRVGAASMS